jgi:sugar/nucleoside kinase (ribokinase family)
MKGVICSGAIIHDTLVRPVEAPEWGTTTIVETIETHIGGNGANTSIALATLGVPVRVVGAVGNDEQGRRIIEALDRAGVETNAVARMEGPTAATVALVNSAGNRKFLHRPGAAAKAFAEPVQFPPELTAGMTHYHLASLFILPNFRPHAAPSLAHARAAKLATSLDTNWDPLGRWMLDLGPCLADLDYLFMNEDEARMITGSADPAQSAAALIARGTRIAVMKLGARGCAVYTGEREIRCPPFEVTARDTTGAGDCFVAGFLAARLRGAGLGEAGEFANAVGAATVQCVGATAGLRGFEETGEWARLRRDRRDQGL